ncbi:MAG: hypothetical protein KKF33_10545 [Alphaproteobacteria bacterium]|jgi:hypothetical protein|nr:hypothetical protein [Alphaproteobacteria bacterium]
MRTLIAAIMVAGATLVGGQAIAADLPYYPPVIEIPDVDYGVQGAFYLRGSAAGNVLWTKEVVGCGCGGPTTYPTDSLGYGYSYGAGFGYEFGNGLRVDATIDSIGNTGAGITKATGNAAIDGKYSVNLRSTIALANVYYDFSFAGGGNGGYSAAGGAFGYVGAGIGGAYNDMTVNAPAGNPIPGGTNWSLAAAGMVGAGYDFGKFTADLGYRGIYMASVTNRLDPTNNFEATNNWIHELRTTVRYRIN